MFIQQQLENTSEIENIKDILYQYNDLLTEEQKEKIYNYYKQAFYGRANKDYTDESRNLAREYIKNQIKFLENENYDSKKYKVKLIDKLGFDTWLSWIFGTIILNCEIKITKIKCINNFIKDYFINKRLKKLAENLGTSVLVFKNGWEEEKFYLEKK